MKRIILVAVCLSQVACTTPTRMSVQDLANFQYDCSRRDEQYQFLESQKYSDNERFMTALGMTSVIGVLSNVYNGTANDSSAAMRGEHEAMIKHNQRILREQCRSEDYTKWQQDEQKKFIDQRERSLGRR